MHPSFKPDLQKLLRLRKRDRNRSMFVREAYPGEFTMPQDYVQIVVVTRLPKRRTYVWPVLALLVRDKSDRGRLIKFVASFDNDAKIIVEFGHPLEALARQVQSDGVPVDPKGPILHSSSLYEQMQQYAGRRGLFH